MSSTYPPPPDGKPVQVPSYGGPAQSGPPPVGPTQPGYGMPAYPSPSSQPPNVSGGGFFAALFDFSFSSFVTPKIVKLVYVLATIAVALLYLVFVITAFTKNAGAGVVVLLLGAVGALVYLAFIRMTLEFYFAIVRMSQDINERLPRR